MSMSVIGWIAVGLIAGVIAMWQREGRATRGVVVAPILVVRTTSRQGLPRS